MIKFWNTDSCKTEEYGCHVSFTFEDGVRVMRKASLKISMEIGKEGGKEGKPCLTINLGDKKLLTPTIVKRGIATAINEATKLGLKSAKLCLSGIENELNGKIVNQVVIGAIVTLSPAYSLKSDKKEHKDDFTLYIANKDGKFTQEAIDESQNIAEQVLLAREFVNRPPAMKTPKLYAENVEEICKKEGIDYTIYDEKYIESQKMGAFWAVGSSSGNMPRLVVMRHMGNPSAPDDITGFIGKGLTFDTGGYDLKPSAGMGNMKNDMAGSAAVIAAMVAIKKNNVKANIVAVCPLAENRISRESFLQADVLTAMDGTTIQILSTDAEGRLVMSDAMTYAIREEKVKRVLDIATLTGAAVAAFGRYTAATMTNNDDFYNKHKEAAKISGEQYWQMPSNDEYYMQIENGIADLKNTGGAAAGGGGVMHAGLFMEHFAKGLPWIHMDIAGTAFGEAPSHEFHKAGGTGHSVETLYEFAKQLAK